MAVLQYRVGEVARASATLHNRVRDHDRELEQLRTADREMHEQISGEGGLQNSLRLVREELKDIRRGIYALTGTFILAIVTLATAIATHAL